MVEIKWGDRSDLEKHGKFVCDYLSKLTQEQLLSVINQEQASEEDLESIWLIENHIKESPKVRKTIDC